MKTLIRTVRILVALAAVFAMPYLATAARTWSFLNPSPATTNITAGVATNITTTVSVANTGGGSGRYIGVAEFVLSFSPAEPTVSISINPTNLTWGNVNATNTATLAFTTTASTPSNTYAVQIVIKDSTNSANVIPVTNTFVVTMASGVPFNPLKVWTPAGANTNWSTAGNWSPSGSPGSLNDVKFFDAGAVGTAGNVNNFADTSSTIASLAYGQTNNSHTTLIAPGATLSVTGLNGLSAGTGTDNGDGQVTVNTITGAGGALVFNNSSALVNIGQSHPTSDNGVSQARATLDLSGLDSFTATASRVLVGVDLTIRGSGGVLNLARTNKITLTGSTAPQLDVGDNSQASGSPTIPSILLLGQTNVVFADSIAVGRGKTDANGASMHFNSSFASPVAYFRGASGGASRVGIWSIGDAAGSRTFVTVGTNDFSLGTVDARLDTMFVGKGASVALGTGANNPGTGYLIFNAGNIDVNTLAVGYSIDGTGTGTINANGGSLVVNTSLELAHGATAAGTLNISSATVTANTGIINGGGTATITINSGTLNATNYNATIGTGSSPLDVLAMTNSTLTIPAQNSTPSVTTDTLACGGAVNTININSIPAFPSVPAQFTLVKYATADGNLATFVLGTMPAATPAFAGYVSNNTANLSLDLVITSGPVTPPLVWNGGINGDWNTTTANWKTNGSPATYQQNYPIVRFDNTLTGTNTVNLTTTLTPGSLTSSLTVDNSTTNYTFVGSGKISGVTGLSKQGSGTLILDHTGINDFTGGVTISGGTLQIGNNSARGNLPVGVAVTDNANLKFNRSDDITVANVISGTGVLTKIGNGILTLNGTNSLFIGEVVVTQGTLKLGNPSALGTTAGTTTVTNGGTLDVNGQQVNNTEPYTVSGAGAGGNGVIVNSGASQTRVTRIVTLAGDTTFGGNGDWDIRSSQTGSTVNGDGQLNTGGQAFKLTKVGTNQVSLFGVQVDGALGNIEVQAGTLSVQRNSTSLGNASDSLTVFSNATFELNQLASSLNKVLILKDGATLRSVNTNTFDGPVTLEGGVGTVSVGSGAQLTLNSAISGVGGLTKSGSSALISSAANTYYGDTVLNAGTLALTGSGSIGNSSNINVTAGAILDAAGRGDSTLTLTSGQTLKGSGTVLGAVVAGSGSTLSPGSPAVGTLTISNTLTLQAGSTTLMELNKAIGTNDQVRGISSATYGGTLTVTGLGGAYVAGNTFKLFDASTYVVSSFGTINLPTNVVWNTSQLGVNGTIQVVSVSPPNISKFANTTTNFQLTFSGPAGNDYRVWASTNVAATPITNTWTVVASGLFNGTGSATITDDAATNFPMRFYLISVP